MKKFIADFLRRGVVVCGFGPIVLAIVYLFLKAFGVVEVLTVEQVCIGIFSLTALAFIAGGINAIYQIERLPLMAAILLHGVVLYLGYLATYLLNDWLDVGPLPIIIFSAIFVVGYIAIWIIIYSIVKKNTAKLNESLKKKQEKV